MASEALGAGEGSRARGARRHWGVWLSGCVLYVVAQTGQTGKTGKPPSRIFSLVWCREWD